MRNLFLFLIENPLRRRIGRFCNGQSIRQAHHCLAQLPTPTNIKRSLHVLCLWGEDMEALPLL